MVIRLNHSSDFGLQIHNRNDFLVKEFPFHVLLNQEGVIKHLGRNLKLLFPTLLGDDYTSYMTILYPNVYVNGDADLSVLSFDHSSGSFFSLSERKRKFFEFLNF